MSPSGESSDHRRHRGLSGPDQHDPGGKTTWDADSSLKAVSLCSRGCALLGAPGPSGLYDPQRDAVGVGGAGGVTDGLCSRRSPTLGIQRLAVSGNRVESYGK